ncbi:MAG: hypothetical protein IM560_18925 [Pseudanabaena sp. M085S1SP2A07QC]|jgi:hypothetical protein|nr:hypothetical protein [Pseudanabaena sp. M109S1SP2A07QC]MCA6579457.1 hypothetical protein [Pseudanabaena sp. M085S1SP2A07QC]
MSLQDALAVLTFALAIAGLVFALGKHAQNIATNTDDINNLARRLENHIERTDKRLDDIAKFTIRVDQRVANLERQTFGDDLTEFLRSGVNFRSNNDGDTGIG